MIFLGLASNLSGGQILRQLFAWGTKRDSEKLKRDLAEKYQSEPECVRLYHTGRSALAAGFRAIGASSGRVILPGLTCIAVVRAVRAAGLEPVYADIDPQTLQYDWKKLEAMLEKDSKSINSIDKNDNLCYNGSIIVAQNTLGLPLDMQRLEKLAEKYQLKIVEDLAHCAGRFYPDGREIGTVGVMTALSFGKGKSLDTSEGGALVLRNFLKKPSDMTSESSAGGPKQFKCQPDRAMQDLPPEPTRRPKLSDTLRDRWYPVFGALIRGGYHLGLGKIFTAALVKLHFIARSADVELDEAVRLTHWQAKLAKKQLRNLPRTPLREFAFVRDRDELLQKLEKQGCYLHEIWYDTPVAPARYQKEANFPEKECPNTVRVAREIVNLPSWYPESRLRVARDLIKTYELEEKNG